MTTKNLVVRFEITEDNSVIATFGDGKRSIWGQCKTPRGAKARLTFWARRHGLTKAPDGLTAE